MHTEMDVLRRFRQSDFPVYQGWFSDRETQRRISRPDECWRAHVLGGSRSVCWVLEDSGVLRGVLQVDWDDDRHAFVCIVVDPAKRGRGLATRLLRSFLTDHCQDFEAVTASIDPNNRASLALALRCGFEQLGLHEEGFAQLERRTGTRLHDAVSG
jgi:RimJ/RimL family protein N-acetyltransferase